MKQNTESVKHHFDSYAKNGDWQNLYRRNASTYSVAFELRFKAYAEILERKQPVSVLDLGCGSGDFLAALPRSVAVYHGIDLSSEMIASAMRSARNASAGRSRNISFEVADLLEVAATKKYDFVIASGLTEYFEDINPIMTKVLEFTSPNGWAVVQTPNRLLSRWGGQSKVFVKEKGFFHHRLSPDELDSIAADCGFDKEGGKLVNHSYLRGTHRLPNLYRFLDRRLAKLAPYSYNVTKASMYIGVYTPRPRISL